MKLRVSYTNEKARKNDFIAGIFTALLVNGLLLWLSKQAPYLPLSGDQRNFINLLPWVINGLCLLVFLLILPRFALGYLFGVAIMAAIPLLGALLLLAGCFLIIAADGILLDPESSSSMAVIVLVSGFAAAGLIVVCALRSKRKKKANRTDANGN